MVEEKKEVINDLSLVEQAQKIAERIEKGNEQLKILLDRQEQQEAKRILGGRASAGSQEVKIDPEIAKREGMQQYFKGTAIERLLK